MICISCELALNDDTVKHCFGAKQSTTCTCSCVTHTFAEDDIRKTLIAVMTPEAHDDFDLLKDTIASLSEEEAKACLMLAVKYAIWMARTAGIDPVEMVRKTALFWSGGEDDDAGTD